MLNRGCYGNFYDMRRIAVFFLNLIALAVVSLPVAAQDADGAVSVRAGVHDGYTRIVLDGPATKGYSAKDSGSALILTFARAVSFSVSPPAPDTLARVGGFTTSQSSVSIAYPAGQSIRHFTIGNRLIVDIKGPATPPAKDKEAEAKKADAKDTKSPSGSKPADGPPAALTPEAGSKTEVKIDTKPETKADVKASPAPPQKAEAKPETPVPSSPDPAIRIDAPKTEPAAASPAVPKYDAHMISITGTQALGVAAFQRGTALWIVVDKEDYPVYPQLAGPQKDSFGAFDRVTLPGGTAFRLKLPGGLKVYGEGGGLVWKIVLTPTARNVQPVPFTRQFDQDLKPGGRLLWPVKDARNILKVEDPDLGDTLTVVPVLSSRSFTGDRQNFVEFGALQAPVGLVVSPKVDNLKVTKTDKGVEITAEPDGLALSAEADMASLKLRQQEKTSPAVPPPASSAPPASEGAPASEGTGNPFSRIFAFDQWLMGGPEAMKENQRVIMSAVAAKTDQGKAEDMITLAKMQLANGNGPESLGFLDFASQLVPDLASTPEFLALRGAAEALMGQSDNAFRDLSRKSLDSVNEIKFWRSYALAQLEDWKQAEEVMPKDVSLVGHYPDGVRVPVGLTLTEVALRAGDTDTADKLLENLSRDSEKLSLAHKSALDYLRGESLRQQGNFDGMKEMWEPLSKGPDDLYRAKAGLALASQMLERKEITPEQAIDRLEGLRYAWRGDELETAINFKLGRIYMDDRQPIKGLTILRQAASLSPNSDLGKQIATYMTDSFKNLYLTDKVRDLNPIDAVTVYDEFSELIPAGEEGDKVARQLAERLVDADLLPRAENLLEAQVNGRLGGAQGVDVALRLASIQLLDGKPDKALQTLSKANEFLVSMPAETTEDKRREVALLRARALSDQGKPEEAVGALSLLPQEPDVLRLRADIAWKAKRWQDAADTLEELVNKMNIDMTRPLEAEQADTILNWAVALYLADNRYVLANMREKYADAMAQTPLAKKFDVITRPRQNSLLADRATINSIIGETDMFKGFLDSFSAPSASSPTKAAPSAPPPATVPGE